MCGIVLRKTREAIPSGTPFLDRAVGALSLRGPDGNGTVRPAPDVELGHTRLAIISPEDGYQPFVDEETGVSLTYNGEIYNFKELRDSLSGMGHRFLTNCDTEVLVRSYLQYGRDCVDHFNGMFAFALYDPRDGSVFGARDRMGIKPLYYYQDRERFVVASEIKAILEDGRVPRALDESALYEYMVFGFSSGQNTLFKGIHELEPGCRFRLENDQLTIDRFWTLTRQGSVISDKETALEQLENALQSSVRYRLISDVPLAVILSGGVDSSLISHYADLEHKGLTAYTLRALDERYDETRYAEAVCRSRDIDLRIIDITSRDALDYLKKVTYYYDEPVIQTNTIGLYKLCAEIAKDGIKVLLSGEGADELLGGYSRYQESLGLYLQGQRDVVLWGRNQVALPRIEAFWKGRKREFPYRENLVRELRSKEPENQLLMYDQKVYLLHLLQRPDRMGMACGIEVRVPFLDHRVVELCNSLDPKLKFDATGTKIILKELASRYLPKDLLYRPKQAFDTPIGDSLASGEFNSYFRDTINSNSKVAAVFDIKGVYQLLDRLERGEKPLWRMIWQILCVETWLDVFEIGV